MNKDFSFEESIKLPGVWDYFGSLILMLLPIIGIIVALVIVFSKRTNSQKRKLSKAMLLVHLWLIMISVVIAAVGGYFVVSLVNDNPNLKNAVAYFAAYAESGINGVIAEMDETGDLKTVIDKIDLSETLKNMDMSKVLEGVDIRVIIDSINTEKLLQNIDTERIVECLDTQRLIDFVGADKIAEYIDFEELVEKVDVETLEHWLELISEYITGNESP